MGKYHRKMAKITVKNLTPEEFSKSVSTSFIALVMVSAALDSRS